MPKLIEINLSIQQFPLDDFTTVVKPQRGEAFVENTKIRGFQGASHRSIYYNIVKAETAVVDMIMFITYSKSNSYNEKFFLTLQIGCRKDRFFAKFSRRNICTVCKPHSGVISVENSKRVFQGPSHSKTTVSKTRINHIIINTTKLISHAEIAPIREICG